MSNPSNWIRSVNYLKTLIPLWKRKIPRYPIYQQGNPQLRVFLPQFWMKMIKNEKESPPNKVVFIVHPQMSKLDVKNYLERIYKVPVLNIRTDIRAGEEIKHPVANYVISHEDDYKIAYVHLAEGYTFVFPEMFKDTKSESDKQLEELKEAQDADNEAQIKNWDKLSIPPWFR